MCVCMCVCVCVCVTHSRRMHLQQRLQELKERELTARQHNRQLLQQFNEAQDTLRGMFTLTANMKTIRVHRKHTFFFNRTFTPSSVKLWCWTLFCLTFDLLQGGVWEVPGGERPPLAAAAQGANTGCSEEGTSNSQCVNPQNCNLLGLSHPVSCHIFSWSVNKAIKAKKTKQKLFLSHTAKKELSCLFPSNTIYGKTHGLSSFNKLTPEAPQCQKVCFFSREWRRFWSRA